MPSGDSAETSAAGLLHRGWVRGTRRNPGPLGCMGRDDSLFGLIALSLSGFAFDSGGTFASPDWSVGAYSEFRLAACQKFD